MHTKKPPAFVVQLGGPGNEYTVNAWADLRGGVQEVASPPNG